MRPHFGIVGAVLGNVGGVEMGEACVMTGEVKASLYSQQ